MIKKISKLLLIGILLIAIILPLQNVYAKESFFEIRKKEVSKEDNVEIIINLNKIDYKKSKFELISDTELLQINTKEDVVLEKNENEVYIEIDKEKTNLTQIVLTYKIPESKKVGDTITFVANVTNLNDEKETQTEQAQITIIESKKDPNNKEENQEKDNGNTPTNQDKNNENVPANQDKNNEINQEKDNETNSTNQDKKEENKLQQDRNKEQNKNEYGTTNNQKENSKNIENTKTSGNNANFSNNMSSQNSSTKQITETVTYNGSNNNYLSNLSVEGYNLNKEFYKDNGTYFVEIDSIVSSININTEKEDGTATVCIYGNEDLKQGTNKILVNVTAENGNVRTYRIYAIIKA